MSTCHDSKSPWTAEANMSNEKPRVKQRLVKIISSLSREKMADKVLARNQSTSQKRKANMSIQKIQSQKYNLLYSTLES